MQPILHGNNFAQTWAKTVTNTFAEETYPKAVTLPEAPERRLAVGNFDNE